MANQRSGDSSGLQRNAFPHLYQTIDEGGMESSLKQMILSLANSTDLMWMLDFQNLNSLCSHAITIPETGHSIPVHGLLASKSLFIDELIKYSNDRLLRLPSEQFNYLRRCVPKIVECFTKEGHESFDIRVDDCLDLYLTADFLLYQDLKDQVLAFIKTASSDNAKLALSIWTFSEGCYQPELNKLAFDQILYSFTTVIQEPLWLELEYNLVRRILKHDGINCSSELSVLEAASRWLLADWSERSIYGESLLVCIRRGLLNQKETTVLLQSEILARYPELLALYRGYPCVTAEAADVFTRHREALAVSAVTRDPHEAVMLFGGWCQEDGPRAACQVFNPRANTWTMWSPNAALPASCIGQVERRVYAGCLLVNDTVHLVGGFDGEKALNTVACYNLRSPGRGWYEGSCMTSKRYYVCCATVGSHIYAIGGHSGETQDRFGGRLDSVERMDIADNSWMSVASMRTVRSDAGAAGMCGRVYVAGGFNGQQYHDTAEAYDPVTDQWTYICPMNFLRGGVSLAAMGNTLYAIGGNDGQSRLAVVEAYQHDLDGWVFSGRLNRQKSNLSTAVLEGGVMVMGGWSDQPTVGILAKVEKFTPSMDSTAEMADMTYAASATSACTVIGREVIGSYLTHQQPPNPWIVENLRSPGTPNTRQQHQHQQQLEISTDSQFIQSSQSQDIDTA